MVEKVEEASSTHLQSSSFSSAGQEDTKPAAKNPAPSQPSISIAAERALKEEAGALLLRKLADAETVLSDQESITLLTHCVDEGERNSEKAKGKDTLIVVGSTGAGKSTFLNYLMGCEMMLKDPEELGLDDLDDEVVVVRSRSEGGPLDEIMEIGHGKQSKTFLPHIESDPRQASPYAYCDCPGFLDDRGAEINIANAVNIRRLLQSAQCVRVVILINYDALKSARGRGIRDILLICRQLFGHTEEPMRYQSSLLLGVTEAPMTMRLDRLRSFLTKDNPPIMELLAQRTFLYDPLDRGGPDFWDRSQCLAHVRELQGIPQSESGELFHTLLTDNDERMLRELTERQCAALEGYLSRHEYESASKSLRMLQRLQVIDNLSIERLLQRSHARVVDHITRMEMGYQRLCHFHDFVRAERMLGSLAELNGYFSGSAISLDLPDVTELRGYMNLCKQRADEIKREREERAAERARVARDKQQLLEILERQRQETVTQLAKMREDNARQQAAFEQELQSELSRRELAYQQSLAAMQQELDLALKRHEEALSMVQR